jgi:hypothetical protein
MAFKSNFDKVRQEMEQRVVNSVAKGYEAGYKHLQANTPVVTENLKKSEGWAVYKDGKLAAGMASDRNGDPIPPPDSGKPNQVAGVLVAQADYAHLHFRGFKGWPGNPAFDNAGAVANEETKKALAAEGKKNRRR